MSVCPSDDTKGADPTAAAQDSGRELLLAQIRSRGKEKAQAVLVVDDELPSRVLVSRFVEAADPTLDVIEAANGLEALDILERRRRAGKADPVLIILDLQMPVMDGWTLIEKLRQDYVARGQGQGVPILVLSSSSGEKGFLFGRKTIGGDGCRYVPLAAVAKDNCTKPAKYDAVGKKGLVAWIEYFLRIENEER